jgi:hypothetical protein
MLEKTIKYTDYNGVVREEKYYFNLTKAEITDMELSVSGGFAEVAKKATETGDYTAAYKLVKNFILASYGEKSADGKRFIKTEEATKAFTESAAYDALYTEITADADALVAFINAITSSIAKDNKALAN